MSRDMRAPQPSDTRPRSSDLDREAWAAEIRSLLSAEAGGNLTAFARQVGVERKTVTRWLGLAVDVSEESVRQVARALGLPVGPLLVKVGLLDQADLSVQSSPSTREDVDAIKAIEASSAQPALKRKLFAHLKDARAQHEQQRFTEIQRMLGFLIGSQR